MIEDDQPDVINNTIEELKIKKELLQEIKNIWKPSDKSKKNKKKNKKYERNQDQAIPSQIIQSNSKTLISIKTILKISSHASKYCNVKIHKSKWVEVIGLLSGRIENDILLIEDAYPMGHGNAIFAEIKNYDNYIRAWKDIRKNNEFIIGWYHSHPSYSPFMSDEDFGTQVRYQKLSERAVALVIDPTEIDGTRLGFEIFTANIEKRTWRSVPFNVKGNLDVRTLPEILQYIQPSNEGKPLFKEYDEDFLNDKPSSKTPSLKSPYLKPHSDLVYLNIMSTIGTGEEWQRVSASIEDCVNDLKITIGFLFALNPNDFCLSAEGITLDEGKMLYEYNIYDGVELFLIPASIAGIPMKIK